MKTGLIIIVAILLDYIFKEMIHWHPLAGFGNFAHKVELFVYPENQKNISNQKVRQYGIIALLVCIIPFVIAAGFITSISVFGTIMQIVLLYLALGSASLKDHALAVKKAIEANNMGAAREEVAKIVSRDCGNLNAPDITKATIESTLENGNDAIFAPIFWFIILGGAGVVLYKLVNTLDIMWGYRNERYNYFGWATAKLDDLLNWIPARLTAFTYIIFGNIRKGALCYKTQSKKWYSPNAGPVMAAGAGALNVQLGGNAQYHGQWKERPILGTDRQPEPNDIDRSISLVQKGVLLWAFLVVVFL